MAAENEAMEVDEAAIQDEDEQAEDADADEAAEEAATLVALAAFKLRLMTLVGLTAAQTVRVVEQGIGSIEDLTLFDDDQIDGVFNTPNLRATTKIRQLRLKGLAGWLRDKNDRGLGFPMEDATQAKIDTLLRDRAQNKGKIGTTRRDKDEAKAVAPPAFNGLLKNWLTLRKQVESYFAMIRNSKDDKMSYTATKVPTTQRYVVFRYYEVGG